MNELQTCLASFAVVSGAMDDGGVASVERHIDVYLAAHRHDPRSAMLTLRSAFEDMRLDGHVAGCILSRLDHRLSLLGDGGSPPP